MSDMITVIPRDIKIITTEIRTITRQTQQMVLSNAIEIGRRLVEAKSMVPFGEWGKYLQEEVEYSQSTANNFMKLYEEYGTGQQSLFSGGNSQVLENLTYTKALSLIAIPAEEREDFVAENHVEDMSTRELERAIRERDAAREEASRHQEALVEAEIRADEAEKAVSLQEMQVRALQAKAKDAEIQTNKVEKLKKDLDKAVAAQKDAAAKLKEAKEHPEIPESMMETLRREAEAAAAEKTTADMRSQLAAAEKKAQSAADALAQAEQKLEVTQKAAQLASPDAAVFKILFEQVQTDFNKLTGLLMKIRINDPDLGAKLTNAVNACLDSMKKAV